MPISTDLMRDTGFRPSTSIEDGIRDFVAWYRDHYKSEAPMTERIIPLIMCGGAGTRLWPASREVRPKQFLPLFGARSTFQDTLLRVSDAALFERPIVITNAAYRFMVLEQLAEIGIEADVLLEPMRRDSGPAIAAGAAFAQTRDGKRDRAGARRRSRGARHGRLHRRLPAGTRRRGAGRIVTFGIKPERAATEYGYINPGRGGFRRGSRRREIRREAGSSRPPPTTSRPAISGTAATSCSARPSCSTNTASSMPQASRRSAMP